MATRGTLILLENQEHRNKYVDTNSNIVELEGNTRHLNQSISNHKLNDAGQGIYECVKCGTSLFSSKAKTKLTLATSETKSQAYQFSKTIRKGALNRNPLKDSVNSYEVVCSKCLTCIGREVVNVENSYFIIDENFLRLRKGKKS